MQNIVLIIQIILKRHQHSISSKDPKELVMVLCGEGDGGRMSPFHSALTLWGDSRSDIQLHKEWSSPLRGFCTYTLGTWIKGQACWASLRPSEELMVGWNGQPPYKEHLPRRSSAGGAQWGKWTFHHRYPAFGTRFKEHLTQTGLNLEEGLTGGAVSNLAFVHVWLQTFWRTNICLWVCFTVS